MTEPHPFAAYIRVLGRGRTLSRSLTLNEAADAMGMIMAGEVLPAQLGAFLMLLRVKEETAEEIAGFVKGVRASFETPDPLPAVDLDWSSYAGKRRQLPWFLLAALVLASEGVRVFMHGGEGHTPDRLYTREALRALDVPMSQDLEEAGRHLADGNFAYLHLGDLCPRLEEIIDMRPIFGLRSPVHTIARLLNPLLAPCQIQGIFHSSYMEIHQGAAQLLDQPHMSVFRGEGGEIERRPNKPCQVFTVHDGAVDEEDWPRTLADPHQESDDEMDVARLAAIWRGEAGDDYAHAAITGTLAIALKLLGRATTVEEAERLAADMWQRRDKARLPTVD